MTTKFKFRGFYEGKPVYFSFEDIYGNKSGCPCVIIEKPADVVMGGKYVSIHALQNVTQFTGMIDKNGKEIYGNDIVIWQWGTICHGNCDERKGIVVQVKGGMWRIADLEADGKTPKDKTFTYAYPFDNHFRDKEEEREQEEIIGTYFPNA